MEVRKASDDSLVAAYAYDVLGRRIKKSVEGSETTYFYAGSDAIEESRANGTNPHAFVTKRIYGNGTDDLLAYETEESGLVGNLSEEYAFCTAKVMPYQADFLKYGWTAIIDRCNDLATQVTNSGIVTKRYYLQKDHLGSTIALTDGSGSVVQQYSYDAFGTPYVSTGSGTFVALKDFAGSLHGNDRFFTGREYDREANLYYYRARTYDANLGRFISRDPIGTADQVNLYTYVANNPLGFTDPTGLASKPLLSAFRHGYLEFRINNGGLSEFVDGEWNGKYDLIYNADFDKYKDSNNMVSLGGKKYYLAEISNILVGFNAHFAGMVTKGLLPSGGLTTAAVCDGIGAKCGNGVTGEIYDRHLYRAGMDLAKEVERHNGELTTEVLQFYIEKGVKNRLEATKVGLSGIDSINEKTFTGVENAARGLKIANDSVQMVKSKIGDSFNYISNKF